MYLLWVSTSGLCFIFSYIIRVEQLSFVVLYEEDKEDPEQDKT